MQLTERDEVDNGQTSVQLGAVEAGDVEGFGSTEGRPHPSAATTHFLHLSFA